MEATAEKEKRSQWTHFGELEELGYAVNFYPNNNQGTYDYSLDDIMADLPPPNGLGFKKKDLGRSIIDHKTQVLDWGIEASFAKF
jgi:uncharacterized protein YggL (DUF469 family)